MAAAAWYGAAKAFEHLDAEIFDLLGVWISGHSLKIWRRPWRYSWPGEWW